METMTLAPSVLDAQVLFTDAPAQLSQIYLLQLIPGQ